MDKLILTDDQIEKMHKVGLEMLIEFDRICKKEYKTFDIIHVYCWNQSEMASSLS